MPALVVAALAITVAIHPTFNDFDLQSLALGRVAARLRGRRADASSSFPAASIFRLVR